MINTQRMLCSNQQALAQAWPFLDDRPPVIVDWLPWSHTFGGNHNFNMVLRNGGTLYIDGGKPAPGLIETHGRATCARCRRPSTSTCRAASRCCSRSWSGTPALRETFFRDLDALFYAAAALPQHLWERLERLSVAGAGRAVPFVSAWGSTETAPSSTPDPFPDRAGRAYRPARGRHGDQAGAR